LREASRDCPDVSRCFIEIAPAIGVTSSTRTFADADIQKLCCVRAFGDARVSRRHKPHLRCEACRMHRTLCICALLPRLETRTRVVILLHQLEAEKPTNTGLVAARCLTNSAVVYRGRRPDERHEGTGATIEAQAAGLAAAIPEGTRPALLFPHASAIPLADFARAGDGPVTLVVPDGTWRQAAHARARMAAPLGLPCVALAAPTDQARATPATERLRIATRPDRLATLEALAFALGVLEGPGVEAALHHVFRVMTDRTLWSNGRLPRDAVTGGVPEGVRSHEPGAAPRDPRTSAEP
jgi:DTW domain-containing protein YfiP